MSSHGHRVDTPARDRLNPEALTRVAPPTNGSQNPRARPDVLATAKIEHDHRGRLLPLVLPRALWTELHIGDRLLVEGQGGEVITAFVELGDREAPILVLPAAPDVGTTTMRVRRPRSTP